VIIGDSEQTVSIAEILQVQGYDVRAIRPPSIAPGTSRLRLSVNVNLDESVLEEFSMALATALEEYAGITALCTR
jgi:8-amino-7-oxononanoate synthase